MKFLKKKEPTVLDGIKKQIREVEEDLECCYDSEQRAALYDQYLKLVDRYVKVKEVNTNPKIDYALKGLSIVAPLGVAVWGTFTTIKYEKEDTMTFTAGKQFFKKVI